MNKILLTLLGCFTLTTGLKAQESKEEIPANCYQKYAHAFEQRGAFDVEDGTHKNIIITFRKGSKAECFNGKTEIKNGKVTAMFLKFQDGTFEQVNKIYKHEIDVTVVNGISKTLITKDDELINVIFVEKIKPKKKSYELAPEPAFDF